MLIGEALLTSTVEPTWTTYFSPWFPRGGNGASFTCDIIHFHNLAVGPVPVWGFEVVVQTKNTEADDSVAPTQVINVLSQPIILATFSPFSFLAGANLDGTALNGSSQGFFELVRFQYRLQAENPGDGWVHFRMLNPSWISNGS